MSIYKITYFTNTFKVFISSLLIFFVTKNHRLLSTETFGFSICSIIIIQFIMMVNTSFHFRKESWNYFSQSFMSFIIKWMYSIRITHTIYTSRTYSRIIFMNEISFIFNKIKSLIFNEITQFVSTRNFIK